MKKLEALFNAVIVKPLENDEQTYGSIVVPNLGEETNKRAEVIAVGPGHYSVTKFQFEGETYYIGKENEVLGKIKK
jgi:co-chaperonin GroES (HSP10)